MSAMNCMRNRFRVAPPSAWIVRSSTPARVLHHVEHVADLVGDRFQRRADDVVAVRVAGHADDRRPGVRRPVRRAQPGERRHEVHAAVVRAPTRRSGSVSSAMRISPSWSFSHASVAAE